jgi:2,4-dienoyl-CoA reductase (NADPH2)
MRIWTCYNVGINLGGTMDLLFTPFTINTVEIPNRIVMPAFGLKYTSIDRMPNQRLIDFYEARAKGGCGLVIVGGVGIDLVGGGMMMPGIDSDDFIEPWRKMSRAIHKHHSKFFIQLFHAGRYMHRVMARGAEAVAPSAVPSNYTKETPRALAVDEIKEIQAKFAAGARRAKEAGVDGVELIASAGYLICQFLSPVTNLREDEYGGSFENRCRFGVEVIEQVRAAVGPEYPVTMRISGSEFIPGGNTNADMVKICQRFEAAGADGFNVTGGWHETHVPQLPTLVPRGAYSYLAAQIRKAVTVPVFASNRIVAPDQAEELLRDSICDLVCVGRAQIADPDWATKARTGRTDEIRPCVACLQGCLERLFRVRDVQCLCNPQAGFETVRTLERTDTPRRVMIVGAGPAGLEAALTAEAMGHDVHLFDAASAIGGQLPLAAAPPGREDFLSLLRFYENELLRRKVKVALGQPVSVATVKQVAPDVVLVATGSHQTRPTIEGSDLPHVVMAWDVLVNKAPVGDNVVVIGGGAVGIETALAIAEKGTLSAEALKFLLKHEAEDLATLRRLALEGTKRVAIVELLPRIGKGLGPANKWVFLKELDLLGVRVQAGSRVARITSDKVEWIGEEGRGAIPADTVVLALGASSNTDLAKSLADSGIEMRSIGDAREPRTIFEAVHEGFLAAREL